MGKNETENSSTSESLYRSVVAGLTDVADPIRAQKQAAYMRDQFEFFGVSKPELRKTIKPFLSSLESVDWQFVHLCWNNEKRELQYVAAEHLRQNAKTLTTKDLTKIAGFVSAKSWWDTVDSLAGSVAIIVRNWSEAKRTMRTWATDDDFWIRREAIICQLGTKEKTDVDLLSEVILANLGSKEFFINKAIGWALRDYAKTDPEWVKQFLKSHGSEMVALSVREASKHL